MNSNRLWIALTVTSIVAAGVTAPPGLAQVPARFAGSFNHSDTVCCVNSTFARADANFFITVLA